MSTDTSDAKQNTETEKKKAVEKAERRKHSASKQDILLLGIILAVVALTIYMFEFFQ